MDPPCSLTPYNVLDSSKELFAYKATTRWNKRPMVMSWAISDYSTSDPWWWVGPLAIIQQGTRGIYSTINMNVYVAFTYVVQSIRHFTYSIGTSTLELKSMKSSSTLWVEVYEVIIHTRPIRHFTDSIGTSDNKFTNKHWYVFVLNLSDVLLSVKCVWRHAYIILTCIRQAR